MTVTRRRDKEQKLSTEKKKQQQQKKKNYNQNHNHQNPPPRRPQRPAQPPCMTTIRTVPVFCTCFVERTVYRFLKQLLVTALVPLPALALVLQEPRKIWQSISLSQKQGGLGFKIRPFQDPKKNTQHSVQNYFRTPQKRSPIWSLKTKKSTPGPVKPHLKGLSIQSGISWKVMVQYGLRYHGEEGYRRGPGNI